MGWVVQSWDYRNHSGFLKIIPYKTDLAMFRAIKTRQNHSCSNCKNKIPKGTYSYGSYWTRLCLSCGSKFLETGITQLEKVKDYIRKNQEELKKNKEKWETNNILASL